MLIRLQVGFFTFILILYILFIGSAVNASSFNKNLELSLKEEISKLNDAESIFADKTENIHISFFLDNGYKETNRIDVIKSTKNVAGIQSSL